MFYWMLSVDVKIHLDNDCNWSLHLSENDGLSWETQRWQTRQWMIMKSGGTKKDFNRIFEGWSQDYDDGGEFS